jgi:hypothetical protein
MQLGCASGSRTSCIAARSHRFAVCGTAIPTDIICCKIQYYLTLHRDGVDINDRRAKQDEGYIHELITGGRNERRRGD